MRQHSENGVEAGCFNERNHRTEELELDAKAKKGIYLVG
jgi:hypothetical protein